MLWLTDFLCVWSTANFNCKRVITETPAKRLGDFAALPKYYSGDFWYEGAFVLEVVIPLFIGFKELVRTFSPYGRHFILARRNAR